MALSSSFRARIHLLRAPWSPGVLLVLLFGVVSCFPDNRYSPLLEPVSVTRGNLAGEWRGWEGSLLTLGEGGEAEVKNLDGQEWRFRENWRMSGKGRWKLLEAAEYRGPRTVGEGRVVEVTVTNDGVAGQGENTSEGRDEEAPDEYTWLISVGKKDGRVMLYFLTDDPDTHHHYMLWK